MQETWQLVLRPYKGTFQKSLKYWIFIEVGLKSVLVLTMFARISAFYLLVIFALLNNQRISIIKILKLFQVDGDSSNPKRS